MPKHRDVEDRGSDNKGSSKGSHKVRLQQDPPASNSAIPISQSNDRDESVELLLNNESAEVKGGFDLGEEDGNPEENIAQKWGQEVSQFYTLTSQNGAVRIGGIS